MPPDPADEELDLTPAQRARIDERFATLEELENHEVLEVPADADRAVVRKAYFERIAEFHPDRYFRKRLGPYKLKMEAIARKVTEAYEGLQSQRRGGADAPAAKRPSPPPAPDPAREKALAALKQQFEARRAEAKRLLDDAKRASAHGDLAGAAEACRKAAALAPNDRDVHAAYAGARQAADEAAAGTLAKQAEFEERFGHWAEAAQTWQRVVDARPADEQARRRLDAARAKAASTPPSTRGRGTP